VGSAFDGLDKAQKETEDALKATVWGSFQHAGATTGAALTLAGIFLAIAVTANWAGWQSFANVLLGGALMFVVLLAANELVRLAKCRAALAKLSQTNIFYGDLIREAREERDEAKAALQEMLVGRRIEERVANYLNAAVDAQTETKE